MAKTEKKLRIDIVDVKRANEKIKAYKGSLPTRTHLRIAEKISEAQIRAAFERASKRIGQLPKIDLRECA